MIRYVSVFAKLRNLALVVKTLAAEQWRNDGRLAGVNVLPEIDLELRGVSLGGKVTNL